MKKLFRERATAHLILVVMTIGLSAAVTDTCPKTRKRICRNKVISHAKIPVLDKFHHPFRLGTTFIRFGPTPLFFKDLAEFHQPTWY